MRFPKERLKRRAGCPSYIRCAAVLAVCTIFNPLEAKDYHLVYLGGQSNMDGYGSVNELPKEMAREKAIKQTWIFHGNEGLDGQPPDGRGKWSRLQPGHGRRFTTDGKKHKYSDRFGIELTLARRLKELYPQRNFAFIKYSRGGTSIDHEAPAAKRFGCWEPNWQGGEGKGKGINQYDHFLATVANAKAVKDIDGDRRPDRLIPMGILWMQGESDATGTAEIAREYSANLKRLMKRIRAAFDAEKMPIVIGRITDWEVWTHGEIVRAEQARFVKEDIAAGLVTSTDAYGNSDPWHYDTAGYLDLGKQFADGLARVENETNFRTDTDNDPHKPWYQVQPGRFPPVGSAHHVAGELLSQDAFERTLEIRVDRNDTQQRSHWDLPLGLDLLPYGAVRYHGTYAALRDIPIGTHLHAQCYVRRRGEAPGKTSYHFHNRTSPEEQFRHCLRLEDDFSYHAGRGEIWRVDAVDLETKKLKATLMNAGKPEAKTFDLLAGTRVFVGSGFGDLKSIKAGQQVLFNLTWVGQFGPGRIREIWLDETARELARKHQLQIHHQFIRERGFPGWVDAVHDEERVVAITFFDSFDPALFKDLGAVNPEPLGWPTSGGAKDDNAPKGTIAVARESLLTYDPTNDRKGGNILGKKKVPKAPGSSGLQIQVQCGMLLEGYRPTKIVRFYPAIWKFITIPKEERFFGRE